MSVSDYVIWNFPDVIPESHMLPASHFPLACECRKDFTFKAYWTSVWDHCNHFRVQRVHSCVNPAGTLNSLGFLFKSDDSIIRIKSRQAKRPRIIRRNKSNCCFCPGSNMRGYESSKINVADYIPVGND